MVALVTPTAQKGKYYYKLVTKLHIIEPKARGAALEAGQMNLASN